MNYKKTLRLFWSQNKIVLCALVGFCVLIACKSKQATSEQRQEQNWEEKALRPTEDFLLFYKKFHDDSVFQLASIVFPLEGLPDQADPDYIGSDKFYYTRDTWVIQTGSLESNKDFDHEFKVILPTLIEDIYTHKENKIKVIRRFAKASEGWRLIYYAGLNFYKNQE
ncbi:MAG TPA: hypothetical protein PK006_06395 [Saprospiraceae bacterium]|nr:hypothetical protein [Saprospiraceae bacterium]